MYTLGYLKIIGQILFLGERGKHIGTGRPLACTTLGSWFVIWEELPERPMKYSGQFGRAEVCVARTNWLYVHSHLRAVFLV